MRRTLVPREDLSKHKGHGQMIRYYMSKEELEQHFAGIKKDDVAYKQRNLARFQYNRQQRESMREPMLEDQMSIYDLERE